MSAQRTVPPAPSSRALIVALVIGAAIGAAGVLLLNSESTRRGERASRRAGATALSPDKSLTAVVWESACGEAWCTELALGRSPADAAALGERARIRCDEIAWTPDGKRVAFLIDGHQLTIYDAQSRKQAGTVALMTVEAAQARVARGVTFSENGRAVTFDDCPRGQSGCRAGVVGIPQ